uniref:Type VI secretion system secreted protein VgrG n=1 Tax=Parastrongyloides trichosuri TaxID=131310 RepID=A0A0N4Z5J1_PARTI
MQAAVVINVQLFDNAVFQQGGKTLGAHAQAFGRQVKFQTQCFGPDSAAVSQQTHFAIDVQGLAPSAHHERIVHSHAPDLIHTSGLELVCLGDKAWQVLLGAGGGESAGNGKHGNFLAFNQISHLKVVGAHRAAFCGGFNVLAKGRVWNARTD